MVLLCGADPQLVLDPLLKRAAETLLPARRHAQPALGKELRDDPGDFYVLDHRPEYGEAWLALGAPCDAACMALSRMEMRRLGRAHEVLMARLAIAEFRAVRPEVELLGRVLEVLDGEEIMVFDPSLRRGYRIRVTGILDVDQLQTLLAGEIIGDEEPGWLPGTPFEATAVAVARNRLSVEEIRMSAVWDLWTWFDLQPDGTVPHGIAGWIEGEQTPASIPAFDGMRVILLLR